MAKLTNLTRRDIDLPSRHVIPRLGTLETTNEVIRGDNWPKLNGLILSGDVAVEFDPEEAPEQGETMTQVVSTPIIDLPGDPVKIKPAKG
ncbi:hypothetical protein DWF04_022735 [Cereibacter sphaeroides f. sp. denitrificans]|nr:hypothetical protein DWF04_15410 [Cereibacter sphaeroides f. sp. denitrificans]